MSSASSESSPRQAVHKAKLLRGLAPAIICWVALVGWLAWAIYARTQWSKETDEANLGEWLDEARVFQIAHAYEQSTDWHTVRPPVVTNPKSE